MGGFRATIEAGDVDAALALLADDVVFTRALAEVMSAQFGQIKAEARQA
jgi:ketosteroid isomerase-like protein